jgi:hypothetical protein
VSSVLDPSEIAERMERVMAALEELVDEVRDAAHGAAVAEATYKAAFAQARLKARVTAENDGRRLTTDAAEDAATAGTQDERLDYLIATSRLTSARDALRARQAVLDGLRTLSAAVRGAGG